MYTCDAATRNVQHLGVIQSLRGQEVDKGVTVTRKFMLGQMTKVRYLSRKMSTIVHSMRVGGKNWVKFGPRSCRMSLVSIFYHVLAHTFLAYL
jgi:hypothetical protein